MQLSMQSVRPRAPGALFLGSAGRARPSIGQRRRAAVAAQKGSSGGKTGKKAAEPMKQQQQQEEAPKDVAEAAQQMAAAAEKLAETARSAAEEVAATAAAQTEAVSTQAEATQQDMLFTAEQLAQGVASDVSDIAAATVTAASTATEAVASDVSDIAASTVAAGKAVQEDLASDVSQAVEDALSTPAPAAPAVPAGAAPAPATTPAASAPAAAQGSDATTSSGSGSSSGKGSGRAAESAASLKLRLVEVVASLDRGVAATREQREAVDGLCRQLESAAGPVVLSRDSFQGAVPTMRQLEGRWRLLYSSGFSSGRLGGLRPGPSITISPFLLGQVYQDISGDGTQLDNVVDLIAKYTLAGLPGIPGLQDASTPVATATLKHSMQVVGGGTIEITYDATSVRLSGGLRGWLDSVPALNLPGVQDLLKPLGVDTRRVRSARFDVVYLDDDLRVTRGDRSELRIFVKGGL